MENVVFVITRRGCGEMAAAIILKFKGMLDDEILSMKEEMDARVMLTSYTYDRMCFFLLLNGL